jgi:photosystem II stability/assembly factor-like uncharacterized protein
MKHNYLLLFFATLILGSCKEDIYVLDSYSTMRYDVLALPTPGDTLALRTVDFVSDREGFAGGDAGTFFSTTDAGLTWARHPQPGLGTFNKLVFTTATTGWAATTAGLYRTTDGGRTWLWATMPAFQSAGAVYDVQFVTPQVGYAVGEQAAIYKTTNGGKSWINVQQRRDKRYLLRAVSFSSPDSGMVVGAEESRWLTTDGGRTWDFYDRFGSREDGYYDVLCTNLETYLLATPTGFKSYTAASQGYPATSDEPYDYPVYGLASAGPNGPVVGVGKHTIIRRHEEFSQNEYTPWVYVHTPDGTNLTETFYAADFADAGTFYAVGARGVVYRFHYR